MSQYEILQAQLSAHPRNWLITGVAGFIGCNLLETLLAFGQRVVGLDSFATGHRHNLDQIQATVGSAQWQNFELIEGDIRNIDICRKVVHGVDYVLHQAALGSVPRSIEDPILTSQSNIDGFLNMLVAARDAKVKRFVYASSSSVYGDHLDLPKVEERIGRPLSPYAVTKCVNELYADVFARTYALQSIGLRYFNIFGPHQDPNGAYAAVIPKWIAAMLNGEAVYVNGDGAISRDFCYVANAIQSNLLAATTDNPGAVNEVYNIAVGERTNLDDLHCLIRTELQAMLPRLRIAHPQRRDFRAGDVRHSLASIDKARSKLGYQPSHTVAQGLMETIDWYVQELGLPIKYDS